MNERAKTRAYVAFVIGSIALAMLALAVTSCAAEAHSIKQAGYIGGATGGAAALGFLAGPLVGAVAAAVTAIITLFMLQKTDFETNHTAPPVDPWGDLHQATSHLPWWSRAWETFTHDLWVIAAWAAVAIAVWIVVKMLLSARGRKQLAAMWQALKSGSLIGVAKAIAKADGWAHSDPIDPRPK